MSNFDPSCLYSGNAAFLEQLYEKYLQNPTQVEPDWRDYFARLGDGAATPDIPHSKVRQTFFEAAMHKGAGEMAGGAAEAVAYRKQVSVLQLINAYRFRGHQQADLDPLKQYQRPNIPDLSPAYHELTEADMDGKLNDLRSTKGSTSPG